MSVVGKFYVQSIESHEGATASDVRLGAVCRGVENALWSSATPSGSIQMNILNDAATAQFEKGAEYLVTFTKVAKPAPQDGHSARLVTDKHNSLVCEICGMFFGPAVDAPLATAIELHGKTYSALG